MQLLRYDLVFVVTKKPINYQGSEKQLFSQLVREVGVFRTNVKVEHSLFKRFVRLFRIPSQIRNVSL